MYYKNQRKNIFVEKYCLKNMWKKQSFAIKHRRSCFEQCIYMTLLDKQNKRNIVHVNTATSLNIPKTNYHANVHPLRTQPSWKGSIYFQKLFVALWEWHCVLNPKCLWPCDGVYSPMSGSGVLGPSVWALRGPAGNDMTPWRQAAHTAGTHTHAARANVINLACACRTAFWRRRPMHAHECKESVKQKSQMARAEHRPAHTPQALRKHAYVHAHTHTDIHT